MASVGASSEVCESPSEKPKLKGENVESLPDEVEEHDDDDVSESDSDSEDDLDPEIREKYRLYKSQLRETEGFGIEINLGTDILNAIIPIDLSNEESGFSEMVKRCTDVAINDHNSKQLQLEKILYATVGLCRGFMFYITFAAKDSSSKEEKTYQAMMYHGIENEPTIEVDLFRVEPEKQPTQA